MNTFAERRSGVLVATMALLAPLVAACEADQVVGPGASAGQGEAAPVVTAQDAYVAETGELQVGNETVWFVDVSIDFTYTNPTDQAVYIPQCDGPVKPYLDKLVDGTWQTVYQPFNLMCWGPPLQLDAGAQYTNTVRIVAYDPEAGYMPAWEAAEVDGDYRLVWAVLTEPHPLAQPLPLEQRASNTFRIRTAVE